MSINIHTPCTLSEVQMRPCVNILCNTYMNNYQAIYIKTSLVAVGDKIKLKYWPGKIYYQSIPSYLKFTTK